MQGPAPTDLRRLARHGIQPHRQEKRRYTMNLRLRHLEKEDGHDGDWDEEQ